MEKKRFKDLTYNELKEYNRLMKIKSRLNGKNVYTKKKDYKETLTYKLFNKRYKELTTEEYNQYQKYLRTHKNDKIN